MKRLVYASASVPIDELQKQYRALNIKYSDDDYAIGTMYGNDVLYVYHYTTYSSPRFGTQTHGWISCGSWHLRRDGLWHKDMTSHYNKFGASDYAEIIEYEKGNRK